MSILFSQNKILKVGFITILFCFFSTLVIAEKKVIVTFVEDTVFAENEMPYQPNNLTWQCYRAVIQNNVQHSANTVTNSAFGMSTLVDNYTIKLTVHTNFYFDKNASSKKQGTTSKYLLQHEQIHFDIAYQGYQQFLGEIKKLEVTEKNYNTIYENAFNAYRAKVKEVQTLYDTETEHGINQLQQEMWIAKVLKNQLFLQQVKAEEVQYKLINKLNISAKPNNLIKKKKHVTKL